MMFRIAVAAALLLPAAAFAGKVKTYTAATPAQFEKAQLQQAVVSNEGAVRLARSLKPLPAAVDATTQTMYAATGPHGRVLRVARDGKAELFFQSRQDHVLSLVRADDGTLYAGTDRQGLVYRIDPAGKAFVMFQASQAEVRCLQ